MSFPADLAGGVTVGAAPSALADVASWADIAEVTSSAEIADVAPSVDLAEFARDVTVCVASLADLASVVTAAVALRQNCGNIVVVLRDCVSLDDGVAEVVP